MSAAVGPSTPLRRGPGQSSTTSNPVAQQISPAKAYTVASTRVGHNSRETLTGSDHTPSTLRVVCEIVICTAAIYAIYMAYGIINEKITQQSYGTGWYAEKFKASIFISTMQCFGSALWSFILIIYEASSRASSPDNKDAHTGKPLLSVFQWIDRLIFDQVPKTQYALIAASYSISIYSSISALKYVSYVIQALAKSSKLIPVMAGKMIRGHRYSTREYIHVIMITAGIGLYMVTSGKASATETSWYGIMLFSTALIMDAITGPTQDKVNEKYKPAVQSMTFWINIMPAIVFLLISLFTGEFYDAIAFCQRHPEIQYEIMLYCLLAAIGQSVILWTVFRFNSMTVTIITTTRKFFTILVSVFWFNHTLLLPQWAAIVMVFIGIIADSHYKLTKKKPKAIKVQ